MDAQNLINSLNSVSEKLYSQAQAANGNAEAGAESGNVESDENGNVYNADYKVEDDGDNK